MKKLSVIMPVYNGESFVSEMIDSVMAQEYADLELIVIDDGSSDGTVQVVERYAVRDKRIRLVVQAENTGVSAARNLGLELAEGKYIAFVDADDRIHPSMYRRLIQVMEEYECDMAMCRIYYENRDLGGGKEETLPDMREGVLTDDAYQQIIDGLIGTKHYFFAGMVRYVFRRKIIQNGRFDIRISYREDLVFLFELLSLRRKIYYADFVGYYYMRNQMSAVECYRKHLFEDLMYVNDRVFQLARKSGLVEEYDLLYSLKILEAVSLSISNLYRKNAPSCTVKEYACQIRRFRKELGAVKGVRRGNFAAKYWPLLFLAKMRADWAIHVLYSRKEKNRQRKICG